MKTIKNSKLILIVAMIVTTSFSYSQEKVKQLKIAYITKELNLSTQEAEKFWPIYNEMETKMKTLRKDRRKIALNLEQNADSLSTDMIKKNTNALFDSELAEVNLRKEYYAKIGEVIGYKKSTKLLKVEREFKKELLMKLKDERGDKPRPPRPMKQ